MNEKQNEIIPTTATVTISPRTGLPVKKYNYKKKTGRPLIPHENDLPKGWQEIILKLSSKGYSDVEIRAHLCLLSGKFDHNTWYALKNNNEEFIETLEKAKLLCEAWWEKKGRENLFHSKSDVFETACWFINMKNRFKWTDKTEVLANVTFNVQNLIADVARAEKANSRGLAKISNN